jgi:MbtH protein
MQDNETEDTTTYNVVMNHEEQYSIWPTYLDIPLGWRSVGVSGTKAECLAYIKETWTDMRPLSLRRQMEASASQTSKRGQSQPSKGRTRQRADAASTPAKKSRKPRTAGSAAS